MDMRTLTIVNGKIVTGLYEKALNLYLYIPPHSAHPPGVLTGLVLGNAHRIYTLLCALTLLISGATCEIFTIDCSYAATSQVLFCPYFGKRPNSTPNVL